MFKKLTVLGMLIAAPAAAETWATGDCTLQNGERISYMLHSGNGLIDYHDGKGPYEIFSKKEENFGIITHIGSSGNMTMAVDLNNGRGYIITNFDDGHKRQMSVYCRLGSRQR
jgi:hypothetical protein